MKKIPTLFVRDRGTHRVTDEVTPGCEWVLAGEGVATRKYDGTCVMLDGNGKWWARREVKAGKSAPQMFQPVEYDEITGKNVGWEPVEQSPFYGFFSEAVAGENWEPTTYELCGPKVNGNPEGFGQHELIQHRDATRISPMALSSPDVIRATVTELGRQGIEGIVWHHPDGRMAKLKGKDLPRGES